MCVALKRPQTAKGGDPWMTKTTWVISLKGNPFLTQPPVGSRYHTNPANHCLMLTSRQGSCLKANCGVLLSSINSIFYLFNFFCLLPAVSPRSLLPQPRNHLSATQLTSWVWTLTLKHLPRLHPLLPIKVFREEWKQQRATATSSMTCLRPLLAKQPQCRKTCSSVNQLMRLQSIQHVLVKYLMQNCCSIKALFI